MGVNNVKIIIEKNYQAMSKAAAKIFIEAIKNKPDIVLGLATGSTPLGLYTEMINAYKTNELDFSKVTSFILDEYVGLSPENPSSYRHFIKEKLFNHINIPIENIFMPNGEAEDLDKYCKEYDEKIVSAGGIDLQLLGIGEDGHIAFNEPGDFFHVDTNIAKLAASTIEVNSRFFNSIEEVPTTAITVGMGPILKAKKVVLLASGKKKAAVIKQLINEKKVSTMLPVSFLLLHNDVTVIVDEDAYYG